MVVDSTELSGVQRFEINEVINGHHQFSVSCRLYDIEGAHDSVLEKSRSFVGKTIALKFSTGLNKDGHKREYHGIVMDIAVSRYNGSGGVITISGQSPTILLDGNKWAKIYNDKTLTSIFSDICGQVDGLKTSKQPNYKKKIGYVTQFGESSWRFLNRMCQRYGEWLYYDGKKLHLGIPSGGSTLELTLGHHLHSLRFSSSILPLKQSYFEHDYSSTNPAKKIVPAEPKGGNSNNVVSKIKDQSKKLFKEEATFPTVTFARGDNFQAEHNWKDLADLNAETAVSNTSFLTGVTDLPEIAAGSVVHVKVTYDNKTTDYGKYRVVSVSHESEGRNRYVNRFTAVPESVSASPVRERLVAPQVSSISAIVHDNKDPKKLGRVRVKFRWGGQGISPWIRCARLSAGKEYGLYYVPEINEEVIVGFEQGNIDAPYVMGSFFNGNDKWGSEYNDKNLTKSIQTVGGNLIRISDKKGEERIQIQNVKNDLKNEIIIECKGDGLVSIVTKGNIRLEAEKNISLKAGENITLEAKKNIECRASKNMLSESVEYDVNAKGNITQKAMKSVNVKATAKMSLEGAAGFEGKTNAAMELSGNAKCEVKSAAITIVKGGIVKIN